MMRHLLLVTACLTAATVLGQANNYPNGSTVSDFTVTDTEGITHNLYTYTSQGKYVMLDFFFDTCPPCQATQPYYNELHETYGCNTADIIVLSINNGTDTNAEVDAFEAQYGGNFAHAPAVGIEGGCAAVDDDFGVSAYPTYCLIAPDNTMYNQDIWPISNMNTYVQAFPSGNVINPASCAVSINEQGAASFTEVFPQPSTGVVTLNVDSRVSGTLTVEVFDILGQRVSAYSLNGNSGANTHTLDLSDLTDGQYVLKLNMNDRATDARRIVIAR